MSTFISTNNTQVQFEDDRTGLSIETLRRALADNLFYIQGKYPAIATKNDYYMALAYTVRDRLLHHWLNTLKTYFKQDVKLQEGQSLDTFHEKFAVQLNDTHPSIAVAELIVQATAGLQIQ